MWKRPPRDPALRQRAGVARGALPGVDGPRGRPPNRVHKCSGQDGRCAVCHGRRRVGLGVRAQVQLAKGMAFEFSSVFGEKCFAEGYAHCDCNRSERSCLRLRGTWSEKDESTSAVKILNDRLCMALFRFPKVCCCDCKGWEGLELLTQVRLPKVSLHNSFKPGCTFS